MTDVPVDFLLLLLHNLLLLLSPIGSWLTCCHTYLHNATMQALLLCKQLTKPVCVVCVWTLCRSDSGMHLAHGSLWHCRSCAPTGHWLAGGVGCWWSGGM